MISENKLLMRIGIGKGLGLLVGAIGFVSLPMFMTDVSMMLKLGVLFWYITFGAIVGVFGVFSYHPVLKIPFPWWIRGAVLGAWLNFVITLFAYEQFGLIVAAMLGEYTVYLSPFWMVVEGAIIGLIFDYCLTRWFGEGHTLVREPTLQGG